MFFNGMEMTTAKKDYFEEFLKQRFANLSTLINANHEQAMDSFERLEKKVDTTNGRVTKLEEEKQQYLKTTNNLMDSH